MKRLKEDIPFVFLKFGSQKNIIDLLENGTIYCNTIDYFQRLENQGLRGDHYEGTTNIRNYHQYDNVKITVTIPDTGKEISIHPKKFHVREFLSEIKGNIYCLYSIRPSDIISTNHFSIDPSLVEFGTHFIIIKQPLKFLADVRKELDLKKLKYQFDHVEYYEKELVNRKINLFNKPKEFKNQNEFRIVIANKDVEPKVIQIGSLKEYAEVFLKAKTLIK